MEMCAEEDAGLSLSMGQASNRFSILASACDIRACLPGTGHAGVTDIVGHIGCQGPAQRA